MTNNTMIPKELQDLNQWLAWKEEIVDDRPTKVPYDCNTGQRASSTDAKTWCSYETAVKYADEHQMDGVGFVVTEDDAYTGIDIDNCIKDGKIAPEAMEIIKRFDSYTEITPSGRGFRIWIRAVKKGSKCKYQKLKWCDAIEIYDNGRYFTVTGNVIEQYDTIKSKQQESDALYDELFPEEEPEQYTPSASVSTLTDEEVIQKASNSDMFSRLHTGDWDRILKDDRTKRYPSQSEADLAYYNILGYYCNKDREQIERIFRTSGLVRDKWTNRKDYRDRTYEKMCETVKEIYSQSTEAKHSLMEKYDVYKHRQVTHSGELYIAGIKPPRLSELIINETNFHFITLEEKGRPIWYYNGKHYEPNGELKIGAIVRYYTGDFFSKHIWSEVVANIQCSNLKKRLDFNTPLHLINVTNGVYNLKTRKLEPHSHKHLFLSTLPVMYNETATCTNYEQFLKEITAKDSKERPEVYDTLQEYLGYCLYRDYIIKKYLVVDGDQDNGKTTLMNIWIEFLGEPNVASIPLQDLNDKPFRKHKLYGKLGNFADDLPHKALRYSEVIKQITGRSPIWSDIKQDLDGVWFRNYAKPYFSCNELPETSDKGNAFFERQLQVTLFNKYIRIKDPKIDNKTTFERDLDIHSKCSTPEELSGIFNHALVGLNRLLENKRFSDMTTTEENREQWIRKSDPISTYIKENIEETSKDCVIISRDLEKSIKEYCKEHRISKDITANKITRKLSEQDIIKKQKTIDGEYKWCFLGIQHTTDVTLNHRLGEKTKSQQEEVKKVREVADTPVSLVKLCNVCDKPTVDHLISNGSLTKLPTGDYIWSGKK